MPLEPGSTVSHYRIDRKIGEGGMGEVWAATDTRLNRPAAIKSLPPDLARDPERLARFKREAQLLASLSHPNIAAIYGLEDVSGTPYLALELVEGEDLSSRIEKGPLPVDEAIEVASQIAAALAEAHDKGIIHRDLKPANVKLSSDGKVKVLDFGLAKALAGDPGDAPADASMSPTVTAVMGTQAGLILGTAAYMSPEQARGKPVDRRADVWAFGVVLFEMLTGERLYTGETVTDIIASVVTREPDWSKLPDGTPPSVHRLLRRCLRNDSRHRLRDMGDALLDLNEPSVTDAAAAPVTETQGRARGWVMAAGAGLAAGLIIAFVLSSMIGTGPAETQTTWSNLLPLEGAPYTFDGFLELSPDGRHVVFVAPDPDGNRILWIRELDSENSRSLKGTKGAMMPFWSPDSRFVAYFSDRKLRKIGVQGGVPTTICDTGANPRGGAWGDDGTILYSPGWSHPLYRVSEGGGIPEQMTELNPERFELSHRWPHFLPDGRHFLFYVVSTYPELNPENPSSADQSGLYLGTLDRSEEPRLIQTARSRAVYLDGSLIYVDDGILMARPFYLGSMAFAGEPTALVEGVTQSVSALWGGSLFSISDEGTLLFVRGASERDELTRFVWRDREGRMLDSFGEPADYDGVWLSRDGRQLATSSEDPGDIWVFNLETKTPRRFTFDTGNDIQPRWSPDDKRIIFMSSRVISGKEFAPANLFTRPTSGLEAANHLLTLDNMAIPSDWSPDERLVLLENAGPITGSDILVYDFEKKTIEPYMLTENNEEHAVFSPDGRWIAYQSDESGQYEVYVQDFGGAGGKWQVSVNGGITPDWRRDTRELFYLDKEGSLMAVPIGTEGGFQAGSPVRLFEAGLRSLSFGTQSYDAAPDGQKFLLLEPAEGVEEAEARVTLVQNWPALLER